MSRFRFAFAGLMLICFTTLGFAQSAPSPNPTPAQPAKPAPQPSPMPDHHDMDMPGHPDMAGMHAKMEEMDAKLQRLVDAMNTATAGAKVDAIAAVLNQLVAEHREMHANMPMMMGDGPRPPMMHPGMRMRHGDGMAMRHGRGGRGCCCMKHGEGTSSDMKEGEGMDCDAMKKDAAAPSAPSSKQQKAPAKKQ
jgi:hypothetical protein